MTQGKVWLITGASRGFGRIWTEAALKRGDQVAATARDVAALAELTAQYGSAILPLKLDVTDRPRAFALVKEAHEHFGRLDVLVSCAGYGYMGAIEETDFDEARANFDTNVFGMLSVLQAVVPITRAQKRGHILTVSSIGGILSFPTGGAYVASKFAVEALSESLAGEVASFGIKVTIIEPGSFATTFRSSTKHAPTMPEYDAIRTAIHSGFKPENSGNPIATAPVVLGIVDSDAPPLRLILGSHTLPRFKKTYEQRLKLWDDWADVSNRAQG